MNDIFIYLADFPPHIHELVAPCPDGYTVYINASLSKVEQLTAYFHALSHIANEDFEKESNVQEIEFARHGFTKGG